MRARETKVSDARELAYLQTKVLDLQKQVDSLNSENRGSVEQASLAQRDSNYWRTQAEAA